MHKLTKLKAKFKTLLSLCWRDRALLFEALFLTGLFRAVILLIPFNKYKKHIGIHNEQTPYETNRTECGVIRKISWAVNSVSKYTPWQSKCLVQALTAQKMLRRRKISSTLYLGVAKEGKDKLVAHAWLRSGPFYVTGGANREGFKEVAKFKAAAIS